MPQNEYGYSIDAWTKVFMFYFSQYVFDTKYSPAGEHSIKMDGNLFYIKDEIDINTVTAQNLKDEDFIKNNCVKAYSFSSAGNTYGTYGEFKNE